MIRLILVALVVVPATLFYGLQIFWAARTRSPRLEEVCDCIPRRWARLLLRVAGVRVVMEGTEVLDPDRPQVVVANHVSWFDVLALAAYLPGRYVFVAKRELEKVPVFSTAAKACGHIFIDRRDRPRALESLAVARERLERDRPSVIMFPEGTRSATGELMPFKKGAFVLAIQTGADIVPAAIDGSREVMRKGSFLIRPGTIRVRFGEPIPVEGLTLDDRDELTRGARDAVARLQARVRDGA